ncbi:MAG: HD domain-containing protein [Bacteroidota bacterium]
MTNSVIDIAIIAVFLAINLIVGLRHGLESKTIRDYALGGKNFSTGVLTATLVATAVSGSSLFVDVQNTYTQGLYYLLAVLGAPFSIFLSAQLITRMGEFMDNLSIASAMGDLYGTAVRVVTATSSVVARVGSVALQFSVMAQALSLFFNTDNTLATFFAAAIVVVYSSLGGVKSVTFTDVLQFFTFGTIIPILALTVWNSIDDPAQVTQTLVAHPKFSVSQVVGHTPELLSTLGLFLMFSSPALVEPDFFQRISMAKNIGQAKAAFTYTAGMVLFMILLGAWIGVLLLTVNPNLSADEIMPYLVNAYSYPVMKGLLVVGVMAMAMSTADSILNVSTVLFANDIVAPLCGQKEGLLVVARTFSWIMGSAALVIALYSPNLLPLILLTSSLCMPIFTVPFLLTVLGFRSSGRAVLSGMFAGAATVAVWSLCYSNSTSTLPGMFANLVALFGTHYLLRQPGGWVGVKRIGSLAVAPTQGKKTWLGSLRNISILDYLDTALPKKRRFFPLFGFYLFAATYTSLYNLANPIADKYLTIYRIIQYSVLVCATALATQPIWPQIFRGKRLLTWFWPLVIWYTLFFVSAVLVFMGNFQAEQVLIFMLNLVMTALTLHGSLAVILAASGILGALLLFDFVLGVDVTAAISTTISFKMSYGLLLFSSFLIALFKHKQTTEQLASFNQYLLHNQQETRKELVQALNYREELLQELRPDEIAVFDTTTTAYIKQAIYRVKNYLRLSVTHLPLVELVRSVEKLLRLQGLQNKLHVQYHAKQSILQADITRIRELLVNAIRYVQAHSAPDAQITLRIDDTILGHKIAHLKDYTRTMEAFYFVITSEKEAMGPSQGIYMINPIQPLTPQDEDELALVYNARIIDAHYGYADMHQPTTHVYVIPVELRKIRGKVMEQLREPIASTPVDSPHALASELETTLLNKLQQASVDMHMIHKAIDIIKRYHGGVKRKSGEPFFTHPIAVALILFDYAQDQDTLLAALLHDSVEDTRLSTVEIKAMFGETVGFLVAKLTDLEDDIRKISLEPHENIERLINYEDKRVALIKLADRLHNMRTIEGHPSLTKQKILAKETIMFFVPMAKYLALDHLAEELNTLSLRVLSGKSATGVSAAPQLSVEV